MRIVSGASTDTGQVRDGNEDSYLVDRRLELFAIADGMGGHRAGEVASATALDGLRAAVDTGTSVAEAVGRANTAVWDKASADTDLAGMGTTLTAAWSDGTTLTVAHVGDSRAYLLRGDTLQRVTVDHSLVEELIRDGKLTEEQASVHPQRSIITRALGVDSTVEVDVYSLVLQANDRVMLCSDGLTSMVRAGGIAEILRRESDPTAAANALVDAANAAGGEDNITVVVLDALADGVDPLPRSVAAAITATGEAASATAAHVSPGGEAGAEVVEPADITLVTTSTSVDAPGGPASTSTPPTSRPPSASNSPPRDTARFREQRRARRGIGRGVGRLLLFAVPILIIVGVAFGTIRWYARNSYFLAFDHQRVVLYRGHPGGVLFWDPEVVDRTGIDRSGLTDVANRAIAAKKEFSDVAGARQYLRRARPKPSTSTTTATTATTSVAPPAGATTATSTP